MKENVKNIAEELKNHGIKPSVHRMRITEYLAEEKNHPTADEIFMELKKDYPTLSKTTVYNTLGLLVKAGLVKSMNIEDNEARYDYTKSDHGHFKCLRCGMIRDFNVDFTNLNLNELDQCDIIYMDMYLKGICDKCLLK